LSFSVGFIEGSSLWQTWSLPADRCLIREHLSGNGNSDTRPSAIRRYKTKHPIKYYQFPPWVMDQAFSTPEARRNAWSVLAILLALEELHFRDSYHRNQQHLATYHLQRFGLTRGQKFRALRILEEAKVIVVHRTHGKNPLVTLLWHPSVGTPW
jgi:hypothetical protein